jgi:hypothetical protein
MALLFGDEEVIFRLECEFIPAGGDKQKIP